jgi:hypothetical protein
MNVEIGTEALIFLFPFLGIFVSNFRHFVFAVYKLGFGALKWLCCVGYFLQRFGGEGRVAGYGQAPCFIPGTRSQIVHGTRS